MPFFVNRDRIGSWLLAQKLVMAVSKIKRFFTFIKEVRNEIDKISWPGHKEVIITTVIVFVLATIAAFFFGIVDTLAYKLVHFLIGK